jgi:hypothetical protein
MAARSMAALISPGRFGLLRKSSIPADKHKRAVFVHPIGGVVPPGPRQTNPLAKVCGTEY